MKAENLSNKNPGGERQKLIDKLPLDTPYVVQIFPIYKCQFKCVYCGVFDKPKSERFFITEKDIMDFDLYAKCLNDMKRFPQKIKVLRFVGVGEPLLHPKIIQMMRLAYTWDIAEKIEIITNGLALSNKKSDLIIEVDCLDRMIISIQGLDSETYKQVCGVKINFNKFVENIKYFYEHKKKTHLYIKIADVALHRKEDEQKFYDIFGDISDSIGIEHTVDIHTTDIKVKDKNVTQFGEKSKDIKICSCPFYMLEIRPDGNVISCYSFEPPIESFNIKNISLVDIWNNNSLRKNMIKYKKQNLVVCDNCSISTYRYHPEDDLDDYEEKLKEIYQ